MWTIQNRHRYGRDGLRYPSDLTDDEWAHVELLIPPAKRGGGKRTGARQLFAIEPDRLVRDRLLQRQAGEAHERQPITQLILGLIVRQRIERLQNQAPQRNRL